MGVNNCIMNHTRIHISEEKRYKLVSLLNQLLADSADLISQSKFAHWNIRGKNFFSYHKLFEEISAPLESSEDELAERITALGGVAKGTVRESAHHSRLKEIGHNDSSSEFLVAELIESYASLAQHLREGMDQSEKLGDPVTADMLTGMAAQTEKSLWLLEAHT